MKKICFLFFLFQILLIDSTFAKSTLSESESFYFNATIGFPYVNFFDGLKNANEKFFLPPFQFSFHAYLTIGNKFLIGSGLETYEIQIKEKNITGLADEKTDDTSISLLYPVIETQYYFEQICRGFFVNAGIGLTTISIMKGNPNKTRDNNLTSDTGILFKAGMGYAFEFKKFDDALIIGLESIYIVSKYQQQNWKMLMITPYIGILW